MCGVIGVYSNKEEVARVINLGLYALQHRGPQAAGIATSDSEKVCSHLGLGLVMQVFNDKILSSLKGNIGLGHVRYATSGDVTLNECQPMIGKFKGEQVVAVLNGNLVNWRKEKEKLSSGGYKFNSTVDTEFILALIANSKKSDFKLALFDVLQKLEGAFSLILLYKDKIYASRDSLGFRPLTLGLSEDAHIVCSETCALDVLNARRVFDVEAGSLLVIGEDGIEETIPWKASEKKRRCIYEWVYFAREDSYIEGINVSLARDAMGKQLFLEEENKVNADVIIPVLDSGLHAALGYHEVSGNPIKAGIKRDYFIGRTFLQKEQELRERLQRIKSNVIRAWVKKKSVILVDDSIVRGTVMRAIVSMLREKGAREVHVRIPSPIIINPCFFGIDTPSKGELIGGRLGGNAEEIKRYIQANSLVYLKGPESLKDALMGIKGKSSCLEKNDFCDACFSGNYPVSIEDT